MEPLEKTDIRGNWATLLLPIAKNDAIDFSKLEDQLDFLIETGVNGIYSNGTAGEFFNQTPHEFDQINELLASKCQKAGMPFQIGCSHPDPMETCRRIQRVLPLEPGAIQVILPDWAPPSIKEVQFYLERLFDLAKNLPVVLYNPPHAKKCLTVADYGALHDAGLLNRLAGLKVIGGDALWFDQIRQLSAKISIFIPGHHLASGIQKGASGAYSNMACLHPAVAQYWYELTKADMTEALALEKRIRTWIETYIQPLLENNRFSNMAADKMLAAIGGWSDTGTALRWPYIGFDPVLIGRLRQTAETLIPEFFDAHLRAGKWKNKSIKAKETKHDQ